MTAPDPPTRAALLARLPALGFVPPTAAAPWSLAARSAAFAAAVDAFAAAYWSLPPDERRVRYNQLWNARHGPAAGRLGLLEPGLNVIHAPADTQGPRTHGRLVRELDAIRRRAEAEQYEEMRARTIVSDRPVYTPPAATAEVAIPRYSGFERSVADAGAEWRVNRKLLAGAAAVSLFAVLMMADVWFADGRRPRTTFTPAEVRAFEAYQDRPRRAARAVAPVGYDDWLRAGRPASRIP